MGVLKLTKRNITSKSNKLFDWRFLIIVSTYTNIYKNIFYLLFRMLSITVIPMLIIELNTYSKGYLLASRYQEERIIHRLRLSNVLCGNTLIDVFDILKVII